MEEINSVESEPRVRFFPPLSEQRQLFLLNALRSTKCTAKTSILDIGCGEGSLLGILCRPASALPISQPSDFDARYGIGKEPEIRCLLDKYEHWNVDRIAGLDINQATLEMAADLVRPVEVNDSDYPKWSKPRPRWSPLDVKLWKGGLQIFNPEFRTYGVIFSSEVIEHLPEDILNCFCPMILGVYAPDVLAITTPNYDFNQLFTAPSSCLLSSSSSSSSSSSRYPSTASTPQLNPTAIREGGYLDPTGRTNRVFRHSDHKFEWTRTEFENWCLSRAERWGYTVEIGGVGQSVERDPWGRDERDRQEQRSEQFIQDEQGNRATEGSKHHQIGLYASQTAMFRRIGEDRETHRRTYEAAAEYQLHKHLAASLTQSSSEGSHSQHQLFKEYTHSVHPNSIATTDANAEGDSPLSQSQLKYNSKNTDIFHISILHQVKKVMIEDLASAEASMSDLWNNDEVAIACCGSLEKLYEVLDDAGAGTGCGDDGSKEDSEWEWVEPKLYARWARRIRWRGYLPTSHSEWLDQVDNQDGGIWEGERESNRGSPIKTLEDDNQEQDDDQEQGNSTKLTGWDGLTFVAQEGWGTSINASGKKQGGEGETADEWSGWGSPPDSKGITAAGHGWGWASDETPPNATNDSDSSGYNNSNGHSDGGWGSCLLDGKE